MTQNIPNMSQLESNKSIQDFNKVLISLATAVLTAQVSYLIFQKIPFNWVNYLSAGLLVLSILFCLFSFGAITTAMKKDADSFNSKLFANIAGYALLVGLISLGLISLNKKYTIDEILTKVSSTTTALDGKLDKKNFQSLELLNDNYKIYYKSDSVTTTVIVSTLDGTVTSIK